MKSFYAKTIAAVVLADWDTSRYRSKKERPTRIQRRIYVKAFASCLLIGLLVTVASAGDTNLPIRVNSPKVLSTWKIPAERFMVGPGYKPCMAMLPNGDLIMLTLGLRGGDRALVSRSSDSGKTWSELKLVEDMIGREQWLTLINDGTDSGILFATSHMVPPNDPSRSYIHRSTDGGRTWQRTRIGPEGFPPRARTVCSRNIIQLPGGRLMLGVGQKERPGRTAFLWISSDGGKTWNQSPQVALGSYQNRSYDNHDGFFDEDFTYLNDSDILLHWIRCGPPSPMYPMNDGRAVPGGDDGIDRTLFCKSNDGGKTWSDLVDFGDYGRHYPRVLKLQDGRLLMTYTQRATIYPLGLRAQLSYDDGETWDFEHDQIVIEGKTPWNGHQGGGFGNTIQLGDGTLISCYSYQDGPGFWSYEEGDFLGRLKIEVVRWKLPKAEAMAKK